MTPPEFGATAWGRAWVRTVERMDGPPNPLLPKARSLARNRAVALSVAPGRVDAEVVDGGRVCRVAWEVAPWPDAAARIAAAHDSPAGDLPDALAADLAARGFPVADRPDAATCGCRSRRRPCAHVLAAVYALAQLVDERPVLAIELRSVTVSSSPDWIPVADLDAATFYGG